MAITTQPRHCKAKALKRSQYTGKHSFFSVFSRDIFVGKKMAGGDNVEKVIENIPEQVVGEEAGDHDHQEENIVAPAAVAVTEIDGHIGDQVTIISEEAGEKTDAPAVAEEGVVENKASAVPSGPAGKKRKYVIQVGGSSTPGGKPKQHKSAEDTGYVQPRCYICKRVFASWKGVCGHMRLHPERLWRGIFPPPTFNPGGSSNAEDQEEGESGGSRPFDLNVAITPPPSPAVSPPPSSPSPPPPPPPASPKGDTGGSRKWDLNFPPADEE